MGDSNNFSDTVEELDAKVKEYADQLLASATNAMGETKSLINYIVHPHSHKGTPGGITLVRIVRFPKLRRRL